MSIVIATWNGRPLLEKNLPFLFKALRAYSGRTEVIVVDDAGSDDTGVFLKKNYPEVHCVRLPENVGNGQAMNEGAKRSQYEVIYFLDNDVTVSDHFLEALVPHFSDPRVFAAGSRSIASSGKPVPFQFPRVKFRFGIFWYYYETLPFDWKEPVVALFASAGHSAYRRALFEELGGFDPLYGRFYLEDLDLCYRAWKKGYRSLINPRSQVIHEAAGTIRKILSEKEIKRRQWRNRFLFTWKNIHDGSFFWSHLFWTPWESLALPWIGKGEFSLGFLDAIPLCGAAVRKRQEGKAQAVWSDHEILRRVGPYGRNENGAIS